ncbi:lipopolysaccharide assembly protein LapA domain-containing protein [Enterovirga sp.]|uniref:lipopolysaccharide assembly protein LapA domain-containing protein n=1 Tax=Enterovirga sp. TaxID=2026350 RepID=UPI002B590CEC|nr:lipopolysaccharide assembly protein LapA domain-containing protein [Enterovirga sp.]HMO27996.1 lipopolysaccharide assembly protein LapA domain-containing protein [Enterovirga sp.]
MIQLLKALLLLPIALVLILLSVANRAPVLFSLDPFDRGTPELAFHIPLYMLLLGALVLGVLLGGTGAWLAGGHHRRRGRASRREVSRLKQETDRLRTHLSATRAEALPPPGRLA